MLVLLLTWHTRGDRSDQLAQTLPGSAARYLHVDQAHLGHVSQCLDQLSSPALRRLPHHSQILHGIAQPACHQKHSETIHFTARVCRTALQSHRQ